MIGNKTFKLHCQTKRLILVIKEPSDKCWLLYPTYNNILSYAYNKLIILFKVRISHLIARLSIKNRTLCDMEKVILSKNLEWVRNSN